jgi:hypothetical protein
MFADGGSPRWVSRCSCSHLLALVPPVVIGNADIQQRRVKLREEGYELQLWP